MGKSSAVLDNLLSDSNPALRFHTAYFDLQPDFIKLAFGIRDVEVLADRHAYSRFAFFGSFSGNSKAGASSCEKKAVGLADREDSEVRRMMGSEFYWVQAGGKARWDPANVVFERREGSGTHLRPQAPVQYV